MESLGLGLWNFTLTFVSHLRPSGNQVPLMNLRTDRKYSVFGQLLHGLIGRGDAETDLIVFTLLGLFHITMQRICKETIQFSPPFHINRGPYLQSKVRSPPTHPAMDLQQAALAICGATVVYIWYRRYHTLSISDVPGPKNPSWIYGISTSPTTLMSSSHGLRNRAPMVVGT